MDKNNKNDIQKFLQDAAELETQAFTLEQLAESLDSFNEHELCDAKLDWIENSEYPKFEWAIKYAHEDVLRDQKKCDECKQTLRHRKIMSMSFGSESKVKFPRSIPDYRTAKEKRSANLKAALWFGLIAIILSALDLILITLFSDSTAVVLLGLSFFLLGLPLIAVVVTAVGTTKSIRKSYCEYETARWKELVRESEAELEKYENDLALSEKKMNDLIAEYEQVQIKHQETEDEKRVALVQKEIATVEAQNCRLHALEIKKNIQKMHEAVNIIPLDYRDMDCILTFQQIFRNDLADTMREAVMIYEQRVFRQEVIRGMDRIYSQLDELNVSMHFMKHTLSSIRSDVSMMSQDMYQVVGKMDRIAGGIDENKELQAKILSETRASRYAAEALQQSQEKCAEYMENIQESNKRMEQYAAEMDWERRNK